MEAIVLAAGYATRLYPKTLDKPKALLEVAGRPMITWVLDNLASISGLCSIYVISNDRFFKQLQHWAASCRKAYPKLTLRLLNDGSTCNQNRRGAIGDLAWAIQQTGLDDDLVVVAADNLFSEPLQEFGQFCRRVQAPVLAVYDVGELSLVKNYNALELAPDGRIIFFEEKPTEPRSTLTGIALYYYPRRTLSYIKQYVKEDGNPDQPGRLVQWLYPRMPFFTWRLPGLWYDIGTLEQLEEADQRFARLSPGCRSRTRGA